MLSGIRSLDRDGASAAGARAIAANTSLSREAVTDDLGALGRLMILEEQRAFDAHRRSSRNPRATPHRHLVGPSLMYFHTDHHEIDIVIQRPDGTWGAIEVKLGGEEPIEQGAASLLAAVSSVDLERAGTPAFVAVVTATGRYAYRRDDGLCVVPLSTLAP